jgi:hypothetical protein
MMKMEKTWLKSGYDRLILKTTLLSDSGIVVTENSWTWPKDLSELWAMTE